MFISSASSDIENEVHALPLEIGLKVTVRDFALENLKNNSYIHQNFKLNIKRINQWWFSVYFDKICKHETKNSFSDENIFCLDCGVKL